MEFRRTLLAWILVGSVSVMAAAPSARAGIAEDLELCNNAKTQPDLRIGACTRVIRSGTYDGNRLIVSIRSRALSYMARRLYTEAIDDYSQVVRLQPEESRAYRDRAVVHWLRRDYDSAIADLNQAIRHDPENYLAFNDRGNAHKAKKLYEEALRDYDRSIELRPDYHAAYSNRATAYMETKNFEAALEDLNKAIELNSKFHQAYANRGSVHRDAGRTDLAVADFQNAIRLGNRNAAIFKWLKEQGVPPVDRTGSLEPVSVPLKVVLVRGLVASRYDKDLDNPMKREDFENLIVPETAKVWSQAAIEWSPVEIVEHTVNNAATKRNYLLDTASMKPEMKRQERVPKLRTLRSLVRELRADKGVTVLVVPFVLPNSPAVGFRGRSSLVIGAWRERRGEHGREVGLSPLTEARPFKNGSLARVLSLMLGRQLGAQNFPCKEYCLVGRSRPRGYLLSAQQIAGTRQKAASF